MKVIENTGTKVTVELDAEEADKLMDHPTRLSTNPLLRREEGRSGGGPDRFTEFAASFMELISWGRLPPPPNLGA